MHRERKVIDVSEQTENALSAGRAIITFSRGWQTLVATRSLGRRGVEVITGDEYAMTAASFSRYSIAEFRYPNPTKEPEAFLDVLEKAVLEHKPEDEATPYVLMPIHKETYLIARHRERFERGRVSNIRPCSQSLWTSREVPLPRRSEQAARDGKEKSKGSDACASLFLPYFSQKVGGPFCALEGIARDF